MLHGALALLAAVAGAAEPPERILVNGKLWTGDPGRPHAQALAIRGSRLLAVGTNQEIRRLAGERTRVLDLDGRFVCPGFIDAHLHFLVLDQAELRDAGNVEEMGRRLRAFRVEHPGDAWIVGRGWGYAEFPDNRPHRRYLDAAVADRPVLVSDRDEHAALANSLALAAAGITRATPDPEGGVIDRDAAGEPTGLLKERAVRLVRRLVPPPAEEVRHAALTRLLDRAASYGLTSVHNASFNFEDWPVFERVAREGGLKVRFYWALPFLKDPKPEDLARYRDLREAWRGPLMKFGALKGMLDGTVDSGTAVMDEPYVGGGKGLPFWEQAELDRAVAFWDRAGYQILLHAIGDKAIGMALDAYEGAARANASSGRRHRIEHVEVPRPADLARFRALGVIASTQPLFANPDKTALENFAVLLGPARASRADSFRLFDDAGVVQAFGSDWPVMSMEVLRSIYCAATRMTPEGTPPGGWYPEGRITAEAALRHFTRDAAFASFDEAVKGVLAPGLEADFVVLSQDVTAVAPERILATKVLLTVMGGDETYRAAGFPPASQGGDR
jgi:predicted amidohydrolase YtcJ